MTQPNHPASRRRIPTWLLITGVVACLAAIVVVVIGAVQQDGDGPGAAPTPPTTAASASAMTRDQAADYYLKLATQYNEANSRCNKTLEPWTGGGSYDRSPRELVADVRETCADLADLNREHARLLAGAAWPAEVAVAMDDLVTLTRATQLCLDQLAEARTWEDVATALENQPADTGAADLVRAHLGLQKRSPSS